MRKVTKRKHDDTIENSVSVKNIKTSSDSFVGELSPLVRLMLFRTLVNQRKFNSAETLMPFIYDDLSKITDDSQEEAFYFDSMAMCAMNIIHYHQECPLIIDLAIKMLIYVEPGIEFYNNSSGDYVHDVKYTSDDVNYTSDNRPTLNDKTNFFYDIDGFSNQLYREEIPDFLSIPPAFMVQWIKSATHFYGFWKCAIYMNDQNLIQVCIDRFKEIASEDFDVLLYLGPFKLKPQTAKQLLDHHAFTNLHDWFCDAIQYKEYHETVISMIEWINSSTANTNDNAHYDWLKSTMDDVELKIILKLCVVIPQLMSGSLNEKGSTVMEELMELYPETYMSVVTVYAVDLELLRDCESYGHSLHYYFTALNYNNMDIAQKFLKKIRACKICFQNLRWHNSDGWFPPDVASAKRYNQSLNQIKDVDLVPMIMMKKEWYRMYAHVMYGLDQGWNVPSICMHQANHIKEELTRYLLPELVMCVGEYIVLNSQ